MHQLNQHQPAVISYVILHEVLDWSVLYMSLRRVYQNGLKYGLRNDVTQVFTTSNSSINLFYFHTEHVPPFTVFPIAQHNILQLAKLKLNSQDLNTLITNDTQRSSPYRTVNTNKEIIAACSEIHKSNLYAGLERP